jgi:thiol:disulfide interchange protein
VPIQAAIDMLVCRDEQCIPAMGQTVSLELKLGSAVVRNDSVAKLIDSSPAGGTSEEAATSARSTAPKENLATLLLFAFLGGLILNVMPCVFPVLGIKILSVVNQAGGDKREILLHGLAYTLGVLVSFWALAGVIIAIKAAGGTVAWGFQLQSPGFVFCLTLFLFAFGLNMAGLFEVGTSAVGVGADLTSKSGFGGSFFSGLLATVVATPCAAPFLAPALAYALTLSALPSLFFFSVIGLGLASPYLVLSLFPKLVGLLPRPGAWMESFKQAMSFLMFATVAFLLWTLMGMVDEHGQLRAMLGLVLVGIACWIYGRWNLPHKPKATRAKGVILTLLFLVGGIYLAWPSKGQEWEAWSPELVQKLRAERKPVYIDFTARWCATCQTNKLVYKSKALEEEFKKRDVVKLKADWTNYDPIITDALKALDRAAVPVNVLYVPGREDPIILPNLLTVSNVTAALAEIDKAPRGGEPRSTTVAN